MAGAGGAGRGRPVWTAMARAVPAVVAFSLGSTGCLGPAPAAEPDAGVVGTVGSMGSGGSLGAAGGPGAGGTASGGASGTPSGTGGTGTGGVAAAGAPTLTVGTWPAQAAGTIAIPIVVADFRGLPVTVTVELADTQGSFHAAHLVSAAGPFAASPAGTGAALAWDSIADIGFRDPQVVTLRLTPADAQGAGAPVVVTTPLINNLRAAARRVNHYMITYGALDSNDIAIAKTYQLVIIDASQNSLTRDVVASIQQGMDPNDPGDDVIVLGYVSVGEDLRTVNLTADQMRADPRFVGDGQGPRIDPRGWQAAGSRLDGIDPLGAPSNGGLGFASYYLDDNSVDNSSTHTGDGIPDRNAIFGGCFVNAGAPAWFDTVDGMTKDSADNRAGLREVMTTTYGRGLGCDGVFMDTIDTAAPNSFTTTSSANQSSFEWTAPGFSAFIARVRQAYPDRLLLQNRGIFFFDPRKPAYEFTTRGNIDFSLYESFMLDSNPLHLSDPYSYPDNRYNYAPKLMVEANRADGFVPLSLDYAEGPSDQMSELTLLGQSTTGYDSLLEDINVTQNLTGFRDYITNAQVTLVNDFVMTHADFTDTTPPVWTSTWNDTDTSPPSPPTPRVGIQQAVAGPAAGSVVLRWDVALDLNRVGYALYYQTAAFDFTGDPRLTHATRVVLSPGVGDGYVMGVGPHTYPYQQTITGLQSGATYYLLIRAFDSSPAGNEDMNTTYLTVVAP